MKHLPPLALSVLIFANTACEGPSVTQVKPGVYKVVCADSGGMSTTNVDTKALKNEAIREAKVFAESQGKIAVPIYAAERHVVDATLAGAGPRGAQSPGNGMNLVSFDYFFEVLDKSDLRTQIPMMLVRESGEQRGDSSGPGGYTVFYHAEPVR